MKDTYEFEKYFEGLTLGEKIDAIHNNLTPREMMHLMWRISDKIQIPYMAGKVCKAYELSNHIDVPPVTLNGSSFQLNTKKFARHIRKFKKKS